MNIPENLLYSKEHTWLKADGAKGTIGITDFAQQELSEIVYVDLPEVGKEFAANAVFGTIEAVKTTSDLFMPVSGRVTEVNQELLAEPGLVNNEPYTRGWMIRIEMTDKEETSNLLPASAYREAAGGK